MYTRRKKDYIPSNDKDLFEWIRFLIMYAEEFCERWGVKPPPEEFKTLFDDFTAKMTKANEPNSGIVDKRAKNEAKARLIKAARDYVQGHIARNTDVTVADKLEMRLPVYDTIPTTVLDPTGQAEASLTFPGRTQLMLTIKHVEGTQSDPRAYYGCRIYYGVYAAGDTPPESGKDIRASKFTRRRKELFTFQPEDSGKTAYFCIRYENSKGKAGPWGPLGSAIIP